MTEFINTARIEARIDDLIQGALEVCVATAFVDRTGARHFATFLRRVTTVENRRVRLLLSREFHNEPQVQRQIVEELQSLAQTQHS